MHKTPRRMREKRVGGDHGFTLIELLVVVVIIGVLVAIAIPMYLNYRKGAENKSAMADVRSAITAVEQCYTDNSNAYPGTVTGSTGQVTMSCGGNTETINVSNGNSLTYTHTVAAGATPESYTIAVKNSDTNKTYTYNSATGQIS